MCMLMCCHTNACKNLDVQTHTHTHLHQYTCAHPIELKANSSKASNGLSGLKFVKNIADSFAATKVTL